MPDSTGKRRLISKDSLFDLIMGGDASEKRNEHEDGDSGEKGLLCEFFVFPCRAVRPGSGVKWAALRRRLATSYAPLADQ